MRIAVHTIALALLASACQGALPSPATTTVMSFPDLDCSDCGEELARALIQEQGVRKVSFDKRRVELTVVADPRVDAFALAQARKPADEAWHLVLGAGKGRYLPWQEAPEGADVKQLSKEGEDVAELGPHLAPGKVTVVDFSAKWCEPCRELDEHVMELLGRGSDVAYRKLDVGDWDTPIATRYLEGVKELPYVMFFDKHGRMTRTMTGNDLERFDQLLDETARVP